MYIFVLEKHFLIISTKNISKIQKLKTLLHDCDATELK